MGSGIAVGKKEVYTTHKVEGCNRKDTGKCACGLDWTEGVHKVKSWHVENGHTNNDGEWVAVYMAAKEAARNNIQADIYTDSALVTAQINNNATPNSPNHAQMHEETAKLLAQTPAWSVCVSASRTQGV